MKNFFENVEREVLSDRKWMSKQLNVAPDYDVPPSTPSTWVKSKDKIVKAFEGGASLRKQRIKPCGHENLYQALYNGLFR